MAISVVGKLHARSIELVQQLNAHIMAIAAIWFLTVSMASGVRLAFAATPIDGMSGWMTSALPYALFVAAPVASLCIGLRWFPRDALFTQPAFRFSRWGRWRTVDRATQHMLPLYGATGLMASLLIGILLNVPIRTFEFLTAMPALGSYAPRWLISLYGLMLADVVVMTSLYMIAFVMALRHVPLFPRFLLALWSLDVLVQVLIANIMATTPHVPAAVSLALSGLLQGNVQKVLISACLWLPYLLLSRRVNLTYRARVPA